MEILVLGGSRFVGRHIVQEAVESGHGITLFNRGNHSSPAGVKEVISGDRDADLHRLGDRNWDAVIDTSAYFPRQVRSATSMLKDRASHYCLISTISVYADPTMEGLDESSRVAQPESHTTRPTASHTGRLAQPSAEPCWPPATGQLPCN